jgi:serine/threonine protein kinase
VHPGQHIGKYVLGERIAVGGMAEVWAARAEGPEGFVKPVALKVMLESFAGDPDLEQLFVKEARIAAKLQHANLVTVFDFDKLGADGSGRGPAGRYYIAMERVEGHDARRVAQAAKHAGYLLPLPLALYLAGEVMKGLRYVHERRENGRPLGLVHRDVSPHNVLVGFSGEVKLSDFGIAKSQAHSQRTKTGTIRGKLAYASPEQLNGQEVDHRTDQFAMGITLWELLAGRPLFDGRDELEIVGQVMRCDVPPLAVARPDRGLPPAVEAVVRRMLAARREDRFPTTADALAALLALPGYTADGVGLGELVRTLFQRSGAEIAATLPIQDPSAQAQLGAARRASAPRPPEPPAAAPRAAPAGPVGLPDTKTLHRPARTPTPKPTPATRPAGSRRRGVGDGGVDTGRDRRRMVAAIAGGAAIAVLAVVAVFTLARRPPSRAELATTPRPASAGAPPIGEAPEARVVETTAGEPAPGAAPVAGAPAARPAERRMHAGPIEDGTSATAAASAAPAPSSAVPATDKTTDKTTDRKSADPGSTANGAPIVE